MKNFLVLWTGFCDPEIIQGENIEDALTRNGHPIEDMSVIEKYKEVTEEEVKIWKEGKVIDKWLHF